MSWLYYVISIIYNYIHYPYIVSNLKEVSDSIRYSVSKRDNSTELSIFLEVRLCS